MPLADIDKVLQKLPRREENTRELLAARRIERREMHFLPCVLLFYRAQSSDEVQVAFYLDDGFSLEHENAFRELGGPELAGANHALAVPEMPVLEDLIQGVNGEQKVKELLSLEHEASACIQAEVLIQITGTEQTASTTSNGMAATEVVHNQVVSRFRAITQRCIRMHEHPGLLRKAPRLFRKTSC